MALLKFSDGAKRLAKRWLDLWRKERYEADVSLVDFVRDPDVRKRVQQPFLAEYFRGCIETAESEPKKYAISEWSLSKQLLNAAVSIGEDADKWHRDIADAARDDEKTYNASMTTYLLDGSEILRNAANIPPDLPKAPTTENGKSLCRFEWLTRVYRCLAAANGVPFEWDTYIFLPNYRWHFIAIADKVFFFEFINDRMHGEQTFLPDTAALFGALRAIQRRPFLLAYDASAAAAVLPIYPAAILTEIGQAAFIGNLEYTMNGLFQVLSDHDDTPLFVPLHASLDTWADLCSFHLWPFYMPETLAAWTEKRLKRFVLSAFTFKGASEQLARELAADSFSTAIGKTWHVLGMIPATTTTYRIAGTDGATIHKITKRGKIPMLTDKKEEGVWGDEVFIRSFIMRPDDDAKMLALYKRVAATDRNEALNFIPLFSDRVYDFYDVLSNRCLSREEALAVWLDFLRD